MNRIVFSTFIAVIFLVACNNRIDDKLEKEIIRTLEENNKMLNYYAKEIEAKIDADRKDPQTQYKAELKFSEICVADSLLEIFFKEVDNRSINATNLHKSFINYKNKIQAIDSVANEDLKEFFLTESTEVTTTQLNKPVSLILFKNKATIVRNIFAQWCLNQIGTVGWSCEFPAALTSQNATHFKPNEKLEIIAGIGVYSSRMNPQIFIDEKKISLTAEGYAEYKINVGYKTGTFKKLVKISFKKPDGTVGTAEKEIIYIVD